VYLIRSGHTEAGCDLAALAHCSPTAVICEIMKDDGSMARLPDLLEFAKEHQLKIGSIADLIQYRSQNESIVVREGERSFLNPLGRLSGDCVPRYPQLLRPSCPGEGQANGKH
jgi:3,4-dihydroxy 2-butanone 4-phosphate synthase / GTP cyclohydrolase II